MKKRNRMNYLTLNSAVNSWRKNQKEEFKKLENGMEFVSEMKNYFTEEEMKVLPIYELEEKFFRFALEKNSEFSNEMDCFFDYIDTLTERNKLKRFNPSLKHKIISENRTDVFKNFTEINKKRKVKTNDKK